MSVISGYQGYIGYKSAERESSHVMKELIRTVLILIVVRLVLMGITYLITVIFVTTPYKDYLTDEEMTALNTSVLGAVLCICCCILCYCGCVVGCYYKLYQAETDVEFCRQQATLGIAGANPNPTTHKSQGGY